MKKAFLPLSILILIAFACSTMIPQEQISAAKTALKTAEQAQAEKYAPDTFKSAIETEKLMYAELNKQKESSLKNYTLTSELATKLQKISEKAYSEAIALKAQIDEEKLNKQREEENRVRENFRKQQREELLKEFRVIYDEMNNTVTYKYNTSPQYVNMRGFFLYILYKGKEYSLRLRTQYYSDRWLFIERYFIKTDLNRYEMNMFNVPLLRIYRDSEYGSVWEWSDIEIPNNSSSTEEKIVNSDQPKLNLVHMIKDVYNSKNVKLRFDGQHYNIDIDLTNNEKTALKKVMELYDLFE